MLYPYVHRWAAIIAYIFCKGQQTAESLIILIPRLSAYQCLKLKSKKSTVLLFGGKNDVKTIQGDIQIKINDGYITIAGSVRILILMLDRSLRFRWQMSNHIKRTYWSLRLLYQHGLLDSALINKQKDEYKECTTHVLVLCMVLGNLNMPHKFSIFVK